MLYMELYIKIVTKQKQGSRSVSGCVLSAEPSLGFRSAGSISLGQEGSGARLGTLFSPQLGQSRGPVAVRNKSVGGFRCSYLSRTAPTLPLERMHTSHSLCPQSHSHTELSTLYLGLCGTTILRAPSISEYRSVWLR